MKYRNNQPPRLASWLLQKMIRANDYDYALGDLTEMYGSIAEENGRFKAQCWFWLEVLISLPGFLKNSIYWRLVMFKNYLKVAFRNIMKQRGFSLINICGLAVGIACSVVIILYVVNELSYDTYHPDLKRTYRVAQRVVVPAGDFKNATTSPPLAGALRDNFAEIESVGRALTYSNAIIQIADRNFSLKQIWFADTELLHLLYIPLVQGEPSQVLEQPNSVVLSEELAQKYFGDNNPIGKSLEIGLINYGYRRDIKLKCTVTGVVKNPPGNTHFKYNLFVSMKTLAQVFHKWEDEWFMRGTYTYVRLVEGTDASEFENKIRHLADNYVGKTMQRWGQKRTYSLQPLASIHLDSHLRDEIEPPGKLEYIYIYSAFALLILLIGCMNFINLSAVRSTTRTKEVAFRKVVGAIRSQLAGQFLMESFLITVLAFILAMALVNIFLLRVFNEMAGTELVMDFLWRPEALWGLLGLMFFIVLGAGGYPALVLTGFKPVSALRGDLTPGTRGSFMLKTLVIGQFVISIFLIVATITVFQQLEFMRGEKLGFSANHKLVLSFSNNQLYFYKNYKIVKKAFLEHSGILGASASSTVPGQMPLVTFLRVRGQGHPWPEPGWANPESYKFLSIDEEFIPLLDIEIVAGRSFQQEGADESSAFLVNESGAKKLGFLKPADAIGFEMRESYYGRTKRIVGVVKDFHYRGMQMAIEPMVMEFSTSRFKTLTLNVPGQDLRSTVRWIETKWYELIPEVPFTYTFLDDSFNREYRYEEQVGRLVSILAAMGLTISCLGLFGLALFMTQRRKREIGIRKVLGASVLNIAGLLSTRFVMLILISSVIAAPIAWFAIDKWLQNFAYRVNIEYWVFVLAGAVVAVIAFITVGSQAVKAALVNPVETLKQE